LQVLLAEVETTGAIAAGGSALRRFRSFYVLSGDIFARQFVISRSGNG
jgi:hypothetical protein